jgi:hypothetical protein
MREPENLTDWDEMFAKVDIALQNIDKEYRVTNPLEVNEFSLLHPIQMDADKALKRLNYLKSIMKILKGTIERWDKLEYSKKLIEAIELINRETGEKRFPNVEAQKAYACVNSDEYKKRSIKSQPMFVLIEDERSRYVEYMQTLANIGHDLRSMTKMR